MRLLTASASMAVPMRDTAAGEDACCVACQQSTVQVGEVGGQQGDIARQQLSPWEAWRHYCIIVKAAHAEHAHKCSQVGGARQRLVPELQQCRTLRTHLLMSTTAMILHAAPL